MHTHDCGFRKPQTVVIQRTGFTSSSYNTLTTLGWEVNVKDYWRCHHCWDCASLWSVPWGFVYIVSILEIDGLLYRYTYRQSVHSIWRFRLFIVAESWHFATVHSFWELPGSKCTFDRTWFNISFLVLRLCKAERLTKYAICNSNYPTNLLLEIGLLCGRFIIAANRASRYIHGETSPPTCTEGQNAKPDRQRELRYH